MGIDFDYRPSIFLVCGLLLVSFGAAPLNGYVGFLVSPSQFKPDPFIGSISHLLIGLIPLLLGLVLIVLGCNRPLLILLFGIAGLVLVTLSSLAVLIQAKGYVGFFGWLTIVTSSLIVAVAVRAILNAYGQFRGG